MEPRPKNARRPWRAQEKEELMAKEKKEPKQKPIEVTLWDAANKLRGSVEPAEYKHV